MRSTKPAASLMAAAALGLMTASLVGGCSSTPAIQPVALATESPNGVPAADTVPTTASRAQVTTGLDTFGLALFKQLGTSDGNLVFSPQSLAQALTMLLPGARGTSASELETVLGYDGLTPDQAAYALGAQDSATQQRAVADSDTLTEADGVWAQKGLALQSPYLQTLSGAFNTGVWQPDFETDPSAATQQINNQVSQETKGLIPQLFGQGAIDDTTRLVLTDATYFTAPWTQSFDPSETSPANFTTSAGSTASVPMMNQTAEFGYASGDGWQAVQLPYGGGQLAMDVMLPDSSAKGSLASYRAGLTQAGLTALADSFAPVSVELSLPKFTIKTTDDSLPADLRQLGLRSVFTSSADLSGVFTIDKDLYVQTVVQQAQIQVGEQGTTAAAGSGVGVGTAAVAVPKNQKVFDADHPFVYMIRDVISNQILFIGQVGDPS